MQELLFALPVLLFSMVVHEYAHGYAALTQGDRTAQQLGRLTLNPLRHIDPFLTVAMPLMLLVGSGGQFVFGGAKPVPVNPANYRDPRRGDLIVSSAGIVANLVLFVTCVLTVIALGGLSRWIGDPAGTVRVLQRMVGWGVWLNLLLAFFNLIPIPPLDGSHLAYHVLPHRVAVKYRKFGRYGILVLLLIVVAANEVLYVALTPAFLLQDAACRLMTPHALAAIPGCLW